MQELKEKYNIKEIFYKRYFRQNALNRFDNELMKFLWFREGKFLVPAKKDFYIDEFTKEEIDNFYNKNMFVMPQIEFCITTQCTLKCKDCSNSIPRYNNKNHIKMTLEEFKSSLDKLLDSVDLLRNLIILGGEPLLHPDLAEMLKYAINKDKINMVEIITNGTIIPNEKLINVAKNHSNKFFFRISNYSVNPELKDIIKYDELTKILTDNKIKFHIYTGEWSWLKELGFSKIKSSEKETIKKFQNCYKTKCVQLMENRIDVCPKAYCGYKLDNIQNKDFIEIDKTAKLRDTLVNFYKLDYAEVCQYCTISNEKILPAIQKF